MLRKLLLTVAALMLVACANTKPVYNATDTAFPVALTQSQAQESIVKALQYKRWRIVESSEDRIIAEIHVRTHYAKIEIDYTANGYSIRYLDSDNLDYNASSNVIHRNYNKWIQLLETEIGNRAAMVGLN